jgi:hypothetical protein
MLTFTSDRNKGPLSKCLVLGLLNSTLSGYLHGDVNRILGIWVWRGIWVMVNEPGISELVWGVGGTELGVRLRKNP